MVEGGACPAAHLLLPSPKPNMRAPPITGIWVKRDSFSCKNRIDTKSTADYADYADYFDPAVSGTPGGVDGCLPSKVTAGRSHHE